jgi:hypothetical protein
MRKMGRVVLLLYFFGIAAPLVANEWDDLRRRPGNDDVFVMVDTSLSMAESMQGTLPDVRRFLQTFVHGYLKEGDRFVLLTFDSEARASTIFNIESRQRDLPLLENLLTGLDARRKIFLSGQFPNFHEVRSDLQGIKLQGGGQYTDYCEMWRVASGALSRFADSRHRQLFLLFTDGLPDAPPYRPCTNPGVLEAFAAGLREDRFRMGVVALPTGNQPADNLARKLSELLARMPGYDDVRSRSGVRVISLENLERPKLASEILELISARVDLVSPQELRLGDVYHPAINQDLEIVNRSRVSRTIALRGIQLKLSDRKPLPLAFSPTSIELAPGGAARIKIRSDKLRVQPGGYSGTVEFDFATASRFDPAILPVSFRVLSWWEAYGSIVWITVAIFATLVVILLGWLALQQSFVFAPARVVGRYLEDTEGHQPEVVVSVGGITAFGGGGKLPGELTVSGPAPSGLLRRNGAREWELEFTSPAQRPTPYFSNQQVSPQGGGGAWRFVIYPNSVFTSKGLRPFLSTLIRRS